MSTFCIGPNRFKKAKYTSEGMYIGEINVEYSGVNYTATLVNEEGTNVEKFSVTDDFGGYELSITLSGEDEGDPFEMVTYESASYDRWGHDLAILAYDSATFLLCGSILFTVRFILPVLSGRFLRPRLNIFREKVAK